MGGLALLDMKPRTVGKGWIPDLPDHRDFFFRPALFGARAPAKLPDKVDLRPKFPPCYDQGQLGSCTANAIAGAIQFDQIAQQLQSFVPSRLFIYYNERVIEGTVKSDAGAMIRDGIKSIGSQGAPPETLWPYIEGKFTKKPTASVYAQAKKHPAVKYARVAQSIDGIRRCLASGFPFVFGFTVYDAFESDQVAASGILNMPTQSEGTAGGHAVLAVGYDMASKRIIVRNSWSSDWGQNGYFTMPFDYVLDDNLADDLWAVTQVA